LVILARCLR
jgi:hypothetical protein